MDGRKAFILAGGILCGLAGCTKPVMNPLVPTPPPPAKAAATPPSAIPADAKVINRDSLGDPKPATWTQWGGLKAEIAVDPTRPAPERESFAQQAKDAYNKALKADPKYVPALMGMGELNESLGDREEAIANYRAALKINPKNPTIHIAIARVLEGAGQRDNAIATYVAATQAMPKESTLWFEMGMCHGRGKQFDQAISCIARAADLRPNNTDYAKSMGFMLARTGRSEEALPWLMKAMPEADARYNLARMLQHIGNPDASREQLTAAIKLDPEHLAAQKMASESVSAKPAEPVRTAVAPQTEPQPAIQVASTLPTRPMVITTAGDAPRRLPPLIPVVSEPFDPKPQPPPLTSIAAPDQNKRPKITIGFEGNP